ncbi:MAG: bifunctional precorrin-2 dehydrogenase/sirohydrochlorin ferrochelatase [Thermodesulfobacteriota bacterium]
MGYLPIFIDVQGRTCLVVGGGEVGRRKVEGLIEGGAVVRLVSRDLDSRLADLTGQGRVEYLGREYRTEHLDGAVLVFAATDDPQLNARVSREAQARGLLVNVADQPRLCTFIVPASVRRGDLTLAVSTGGGSPALAARIRAELEAQFGPEYAEFLKVLRLVREKVLAEGRPAEENKSKFQRLIASDLLERLVRGDAAGAEAVLTQILGPGFTFAALGYRPAGEARP